MLVTTSFSVQSMRQEQNVKIIQIANPRGGEEKKMLDIYSLLGVILLHKLFYEAFWRYFHKSFCKRFMGVTNCWSLKSEWLFKYVQCIRWGSQAQEEVKGEKVFEKSLVIMGCGGGYGSGNTKIAWLLIVIAVAVEICKKSHPIVSVEASVFVMVECDKEVVCHLCTFSISFTQRHYPSHTCAWTDGQILLQSLDIYIKIKSFSIICYMVT